MRARREIVRMVALAVVAIGVPGCEQKEGDFFITGVDGTPVAPAGSQIAGNYALDGTIRGADECGAGNTISNPGPIEVQFDATTNTITIRSDADIQGPYTPGEPWTGTGTTNIQSGGTTFELQETVMGTWQFSNGTIVLPGTLTFDIFLSGSQVCQSSYDATYTELVASSIAFKRDVRPLLSGTTTILGLRPVSFRYRAAWGDPAVRQVGLIAEEVARAYPGAVVRDPSGRPRAISYPALAGLVLEEIEARVGRLVADRITRVNLTTSGLLNVVRRERRELSNSGGLP